MLKRRADTGTGDGEDRALNEANAPIHHPCMEPSVECRHCLQQANTQEKQMELERWRKQGQAGFSFLGSVWTRVFFFLFLLILSLPPELLLFSGYLKANKSGKSVGFWLTPLLRAVKQKKKKKHFTPFWKRWSNCWLVFLYRLRTCDCDVGGQSQSGLHTALLHWKGQSNNGSKDFKTT